MKGFLDNFTDTTNLKSRNGQERIQSTLTVKSIKDNILQQYSCTAKNRAASVTKKADIFIKGILIGYIDVGDGCWRHNVLATTLRCW